MGLKEEYQFIDLYTFDLNSAIEFNVPIDQCKAMILLFPLPLEAGTTAEKEGDGKDSENDFKNQNLKFIKQTVENSCALMALLHILLNNPNELLSPTKTPEFIKNIYLLNSDDSSSEFVEKCRDLAELHEEMALNGETNVPSSEEIVNVPFHFVALIPDEKTNEKTNEDEVWLMDGRSNGPIKFKNNRKEIISNANSKSRSFFVEACRVAREEFLEKSQDQTNFAALILI